MRTRSDPQPRHRRDTARHQARLDAEAAAKLEELVKTVHDKRSAIFRHVLQWGLAHGKAWTIDRSIPDLPHFVPILMKPELLQQVQAAADTHRVTVADWLRHAMRQVTIEDVPVSCRAGETTGRSHDSGHYDRKFQVRLHAASSQQLDSLTRIFHCSAADVIRQLIAQVTPEVFPKSWQMAVNERRTDQAKGEER